MDRSVIEHRLESLRRCVARIEAKRPAALKDLQTDADLQDILSVNLERAVQLCVDISNHLIAASDARPPASMGEAFDVLAEEGILPFELAKRMRKAVGFRNIAVHAYQKIDWAIVFDIAHHRLNDFQEFARHVSAAVDAR